MRESRTSRFGDLSIRRKLVLIIMVTSTTAVARIVSAAGNYSVRAVKRTGGEVGQLIDGFNGMLEEIQERDSRLRGQSEQLEAEVAARITYSMFSASQTARIRLATARATRVLTQKPLVPEPSNLREGTVT